MGGQSAPTGPAPSPDAPTLDNSQDALEKAREQQDQARGAAATMMSTQTVGANGMAQSQGSITQKKYTLGI